MSLLKKGMYMAPNPSDLFGLNPKDPQPVGRVVHSCSWLNKDAEKLGSGDVTYQNLIDIQKGIPRCELFVICSEGSSHNLPVFAPQDGKTVIECAAEYIANNAVYVIGSQGSYYIDDKQQYSGSILHKGSLVFTVIRRKDFLKVIQDLLKEFFDNSVIDA